MQRLSFAVIPSVILSLITGLTWAGLLTCLLLLIYLYLISPILYSDSLGTTAKALVLAVVIFCMVILLRVFVFEVYKVEGQSMENTLLNGDRIIVSKLHAGPIIPFNVLGNGSRLKGMQGLKRNDLVLFTLKSEQRPIIKRIVAVPGDTIRINHAQLYRGHERISDPALSKRMYQVWTNNIDSLYNHLIKWKAESYYDNGTKVWFALLTLEQANIFRKVSFIDTLGISGRFRSSSLKKIFNDEAELRWDIDNIGPLVIPKNGITIELNETNYLLYHRTILMDEGHDLRYTAGKFTVDGEVATTYTFKNDYYYALGDNFDRSLDSRQYGFIRADHIIGNAVMLLHRSATTSREGKLWASLK